MEKPGETRAFLLDSGWAEAVYHLVDRINPQPTLRTTASDS
jgi:hypothetical protein